MIVKLESGVKYSVKWKHENYTNSDEATRAEKISGTICTIENLTNSGIKQSIRAVLSKKDQFNKDIGRKKSMMKCMKWLGMTKSTKKLFWEEYFRHTNQTKFL